MDFERIRKQAQAETPAMTKFLRELIALPGESCGEEGHVRRIEQEMKAVGFDDVRIDPMGNIQGWMGAGERVIAFDGHIDTVGVGNLDNWTFDPYKGYENDTEIGGRGASDQLGGVVSAVYAAKLAKEQGLLPDGCRILVTGTVQEEDCDGLCWQYLVNEEHIKPELVVITEPTDGNIYRGQRGRMEIRVQADGVSCHGSAPERGDNAIFKMADILQDIRALAPRLHSDPFLGKGTVTVSEIFYTSPSRCAVADGCWVSLDRRLTAGETWEGALEEIRALPSVRKYGAKVSMYDYARPSWRGLSYPTECYFPCWVLPEDAPGCKAMVESYTQLYGAPKVDKWTFSTNAVSIMGRYGIPCIGLGPGKEAQAHAPNEITWKKDLERCCAVYAALPALYAQMTQQTERG